MWSLSNLKTPRIVIGGTHSGVGKTSIAIGIMGALARKGRRVQGFKIGPDFLDTSFHEAVTGRPSRNLDSWMICLDPSFRQSLHMAVGMPTSRLSKESWVFLTGSLESKRWRVPAKLPRCSMLLLCLSL